MIEDRPAFLFYSKDWAASTRAFSAEVRGAYINLLAYAWDNNGLPTDEEDLRLIAGVERSSWKRVWDKLAPKWVEQDGVLVNRKLERVRVESEAFTLNVQALGRAGGRASARARARKYGSAAPRTASRTGSHEQRMKRVHEAVPEAGSPERTKPASASASADLDHLDDDYVVDGDSRARATGTSSSSRPDPSARYHMAAQEAHALWVAAMPDAEPRDWAKIQAAGRRKIADFVRDCGSLDRVEAFVQRVAASDYLAGRKDLPPMNLFTAIARYDAIMAGAYDNRTDGQEAIYAAVLGGAS